MFLCKFSNEISRPPCIRQLLNAVAEIENNQMALNLHKILSVNDTDLSFETISVMDQIVFTRRQITLKILRNNNIKIGLNTTANKLYHLNDKIGLHMLSLEFVHCKKLAKLQILKYCKTKKH